MVEKSRSSPFVCLFFCSTMDHLHLGKAWLEDVDNVAWVAENFLGGVKNFLVSEIFAE